MSFCTRKTKSFGIRTAYPGCRVVEENHFELVAVETLGLLEDLSLDGIELVEPRMPLADYCVRIRTNKGGSENHGYRCGLNAQKLLTQSLH